MYCRPLKTAERAYVTIKARMDEHSLRRLILSAEQHDATPSTMELLPTEGRLFAVDVAKVKVRDGAFCLCAATLSGACTACDLLLYAE